MLLLWLLRASAQPAEKVPVPRASAYNDDQDPASSFANLAPWLSIAGIPFIGWGGYHTYRHLAPYRKQANDPFRSIDDIRERLADEGEDYWEETQGCIHEDVSRTVVSCLSPTSWDTTFPFKPKPRVMLIRYPVQDGLRPSIHRQLLPARNIHCEQVSKGREYHLGLHR